MRGFSLASVLVGGLLVMVAAAPGTSEAASKKKKTPFIKGPYLQNVTQNSVTVMWEGRGNQGGTILLKDGSGRKIVAEADDIQEHVIDGLEPGTRYNYEVTVGDTVVGGEFSTAPTCGEPFSFVVFGDSRSNPGSHRRVVERVIGEVPDFILGTGDMVNEGSSDHDWQGFFDLEGQLLKDNVLFPSLGNHDRQGRGRTADNYRRYFALPENSPNPERYYTMTYGSARFVVLDSNAYSFALTDQTAWIERELQAARLDDDIEHIFVSMHHPPFSISLHGGQSELREAWTPLFEKYRVAAVFSGHDHAYSRAQRNGVRYFVSGGGGAPLYPRKKKSSKIDLKATKYFERVNHYLRVSVTGAHINITAMRADGTQIENISWGEYPEAPAKLLAVGAHNKKQVPAADAMGAVGAGSSAEASAPRVVEDAMDKPGFREANSPLGVLGILGGLLALLGVAVMVWSIRLS